MTEKYFKVKAGIITPNVTFSNRTVNSNLAVVYTDSNVLSIPGNVSITGSVGIGTTSPSTALHVKNSSAIVRIEDTDTGVSNIYAELQANPSGSLFISADAANAVAGSAIQFFVDASEKARISANGTLLIGTTSGTDRSLSVSKDITGGTNAFGIVIDGAIQTDVTGTVNVNRSIPSVVASHPGVNQLLHYVATQGTFGAGSAVTTQAGFQTAPSLIGASGNIGFWHAGVAAASVTAGKTIRAMQSDQATASGGGVAHNLYIAGTAPNYFAGNLGIGVISPTDRSLAVSKNITGATTAYGIMNNGAIQSDVTAAAFMNRTIPSVVDAAFTLPNMYHYSASQGAIGANATVTNQTGFLVEGSLIGANTNVGFNFSGIPAASVTTGKFVFGFNGNQAISTGGGTAFNLYMQGTAPNYIAGNLGLGTATPQRVLHVKNSTPVIRIEDTDTAVSTIYGEIQTDTLGSLVLSADPGNAAANSAIQFFVDNTEKLRVGDLGQIGIGGANYGTSGQVLTSGGASGAVTWSTVSGGGGATNLSLTSNSSTVSINSDTGTDVTILGANATTAGILTADTQTIGGIKTFSSSTALTTVTAGTWNGTVIDPAYGGTGQTSLNASRTALTGYLAIASSGGTTTLTNTSPEMIYVSGTLGHTITLPDVTTLALGWSFNVFNSSSLTVTVQSSGLNAVGSVINSGHTARFICVATTGSTAASWTASYEGSTTRTGGGSSVFNFQPSIGNLTLTGTLTANSSVGTAGQVLTSNATGVYWSTVSAGGGGSTATYNTTVGDGTATSFTISHNLAKTNIFVSIRDVSTGYFVYPDVRYTSTNAVVLEFVDPPTTNQYYVAVIGA